MPDISEQYERLHLKHISALDRKIRAVYVKAIQEIKITLSTVRYKGKAFNLTDYPLLKKKIDKVIAGMQPEIYAIELNGLKESWALSNKKNDLIVDKRLLGKQVRKKARQLLYDPNAKSFKAFVSRKEKGLGLSDRVWNLLDPFKKELEQGIGIGMGQGKSASTIASDLVQYLNKPDALFKRVRGADGKLNLSSSARNYSPGQGVYRSSYKNAVRLTRTENNIAYRTADHERWKNTPFIIGIEVKLSKNHPRYDVCDTLVGRFPKDYKHTGFHAQCLCYAVPIMASDADFEMMEDQLLAGEEITFVPKGMIIGPPASFTKYLSDNKARINGWKNKPYFIRDNSEYVPKAVR